MTASKAQREDIFVSICCTITSATPGLLAALESVGVAAGARFRYWEMLLVVAEEMEVELDDLLAGISNSRILKVRAGTPFYRLRLAGASEVIGDVVVITSQDELGLFDMVEIVEAAHRGGCIVIGKRKRFSLMSPILRILGGAAGFRVSAEHMLTSAYPRTLLNQLLANPERELALRFPPKERRYPVVYRTCNGAETARSFREGPRRLNLVRRLLVSSAETVLTSLALFALVVFISALAFSVYVVGVWLTLSNIQQGWFTTNLALSLTASFLGAAVFGLSIGLQKVIEMLATDPLDDVTGERSAVDLFGRVMKELNVEVAGDPLSEHEAQESNAAWRK